MKIESKIKEIAHYYKCYDSSGECCESCCEDCEKQLTDELIELANLIFDKSKSKFLDALSKRCTCTGDELECMDYGKKCNSCDCKCISIKDIKEILNFNLKEICNLDYVTDEKREVLSRSTRIDARLREFYSEELIH